MNSGSYAPHNENLKGKHSEIKPKLNQRFILIYVLIIFLLNAEFEQFL